MSVDYRTHVEDMSFTITTTPFTVAGVDIGTATATRVVAVSIFLLYLDSIGGDRNPTNVVIGGVTATKAVGVFDSSVFEIAHSIWSASVPTGTTADVDITVASDSSGVGYSIGSWALDGVSSTISDFAGVATIATSPADVSVDVVNGSGIVAATCYISLSGGIGITWVGVTQNYDVDILSGVVGASGADFPATNTGTPQTVTAAFVDPPQTVALSVSAVWPPSAPPVNPNIIAFEWPNPRAPRRQVDFGSYIASQIPPPPAPPTDKPFGQTEWPVPRGARWAIDLRNFTQSVNLGIGPRYMPAGIMFDNPPLGPQRSIELRSWTHFHLPVLVPGPPPPLRQSDWPNPIPPRYSIERRNFYHPYMPPPPPEIQLTGEVHGWVRDAWDRDEWGRFIPGAGIRYN